MTISCIIKRIAREIGFGRFFLRLRRFFGKPGARYEIEFWLYRFRWLRLIEKTRPIHTGDHSAQFCVRYLVGETQVLEAVWSAKSLFLADHRMTACHLVWHDDGTLGEAGKLILLNHFPNSQCILTHESDVVARRLLGPSSNNLRDSMPVSRKLFDFNLMNNGMHFLQVDTDVLFFDVVDEILEEINSQNPRIRYNDDAPDSVSFAYDVAYIRQRTGISLRRFNGGLVMVPCGSVDLKQVEEHLNLLGVPAYPWPLEQTLLALQCERGGGSPLSSLYDVLERSWPKVSSEHYYHLSRRNMYRIGYPIIWEKLKLAGLVP